MSNRTKLIAALVGGVVVGLLLGMLLFWGLFPVKWTDANTYDLSPEAKATYISLVADSFKLDKDPARANAKLAGWTTEEKRQAVADAVALQEAEGQTAKAQEIKDLALVLGISLAPPAETTEPPGLFERLRVPCLVFFVVLLVLVLGWIGVRMALKQRGGQPTVTSAPARPETVRTAPPPAPAEEWEGTSQPPLGHFFTTYQFGEDAYDESFSIETPLNEFLGECGVGISDTLGIGDPDKVTALEVWLFDKSDIRTVTKVLMSQYAYNDDQIRAKLASKGEAVLAQPGIPFTLETTSLQVRVDVTELVYGEGDMPPNSYFSKLTIELAAMAQSGDSTL